MSFLARRSAGKEGSYFLQESKNAVNRLAEKSAIANTNNLPSSSSNPYSEADVLPEVLRHSLPSNILRNSSNSSSGSLAATSKWSLRSSPAKSSSASSSDALNPLRAYVSLPQITFGPKRWSLPSADGSQLASTANEMRKDRYTPINPEKLKAATEGLTHIGKAFAVATIIVFGGATLAFTLAASKLELRTVDDIRTKVKGLAQPKLEMVKDQLVPLRTWAEGKSKKWHIGKEEDLKERAIIKKLSKALGKKISN